MCRGLRDSKIESRGHAASLHSICFALAWVFLGRAKLQTGWVQNGPAMDWSRSWVWGHYFRRRASFLLSFMRVVLWVIKKNRVLSAFVVGSSLGKNPCGFEGRLYHGSMELGGYLGELQ